MKINFDDFPISGAGSLPFTDWNRALEFVASHCSDFPFLPELPKENSREFMVMRPLREIDACYCLSGGQVEIKGASASEIARSLKKADLSIALRGRLTEFFSRFCSAPRVKIQVVGPITFGENLIWNGTAVSESAEIHQLALDFYLRWIEQYIGFALEQRSGTTFCVFDEPMLGVSSPNPVSRARGQKVLAKIMPQFEKGAMHTGIHCCSFLQNAPEVLFAGNCLTFDASLKNFIFVADRFERRENVPSWLGLGFGGAHGVLAAAEVVQFFRENISRLEMLRKKSNLFLTPACGQALFTEQLCYELFHALVDARKLLCRAF